MVEKDYRKTYNHVGFTHFHSMGNEQRINNVNGYAGSDVANLYNEAVDTIQYTVRQRYTDHRIRSVSV